MAEAAAATRWAEVTVAEQEALTSAGRCQPGDALGSAEGDVVLIGQDLAEVARDLLDRLLSAGGEMATLVVGRRRGRWATPSAATSPRGTRPSRSCATAVDRPASPCRWASSEPARLTWP